MIFLLKRNILLFFKSKATVFYAFLSVLIMFLLHVFFLGDAMSSGSDNIQGYTNIVNNFVMAGIIASTSVTTMLSSLGRMIQDKQSHIYKDFAAAPLKRSHILLGYIISSLCISFILTIAGFIVAQLYIVQQGGEFLSLLSMVQCIGVIVLNTLFSGFLFFVVIHGMDNMNTFSFLSTVMGSILGFLMGIFIPISQFPSYIQIVVKLFPPAHCCLLLKKIMLERSLTMVFSGAPLGERQKLELELGSTFIIEDKVISAEASIIYIVVMIVFFAVWSLLLINKKKKTN